MKKRIQTMIILAALLLSTVTGCQNGADNLSEATRDNTIRSNFEETEKTAESEGAAETVDIEGEYDPATHMRYTLNDDGKSYSVCPAGLPDVVKELVFPGEYKGFPVTKIDGWISEHSIETIIISEGIKEILGGFGDCFNIKNIYIPSSVIHIDAGAFNSRHTMGGIPHFKKSNDIEKIVVAEGNPYYYVDGNCLIEKSSKKIILGCNSSVIPDDGSVKIIGYAAFANCHFIETIILPKNIIEIEYAAFTNCKNLKQVYITSSASTDEKIVNLSPEGVLGYDSEHVFHVPDAESAEIYSKVFGPYFEIGTP